MARYLGIDYGSKRIGLAVSDNDARIASPLRQVIENGNKSDVIQRIQKVVDEYEIDAVVLGLPLMMDGREEEQARRTRRFGEVLAKGLGLAVEYWDERLSSHAADRLLDEREELTAKGRKARRDALAAQVILQGYLDSRAGTTAC